MAAQSEAAQALLTHPARLHFSQRP